VLPGGVAHSASRPSATASEPASLAGAARQALENSEGWTGIAVGAAPTAAFVIANAFGGLMWTLIALAVSAPVAFGVRLARWESLRAALLGLIVAAVCALIAALTGEARGFFLVPTLRPAGWPETGRDRRHRALPRAFPGRRPRR
jgi:hypothetical protein